MAKTNSKSIGNNYEREFCYKLSYWFTGDENADVCWRESSSGGRYTRRKKQGKDTAGKADIVSTDARFDAFFDRFYIDTKSYKEFNPIIINTKNIKSNDIFQQWVKIVTECPDHMIPIMPCKIRDRITPEFIIMPDTVMHYFINHMSYNITYEDKEYDFVLLTQKEFFEHNNYSNFFEINK